jgi:hypothetical protein
VTDAMQALGQNMDQEASDHHPCTVDVLDSEREKSARRLMAPESTPPETYAPVLPWVAPTRARELGEDRSQQSIKSAANIKLELRAGVKGAEGRASMAFIREFLLSQIG